MDILATIVERCQELWRESTAIWIAGGGAMVAIAVDSLLLFGLGLHIHTRLGQRGFLRIREQTWRRWIHHPAERQGPLGELLDQVTGHPTLAATAAAFAGVRAAESAPFARELKVMHVCVGAAPLLGLFGTVTGMLATFGALASGAGGDQTMGLVAQGISEALITTETGLVVALPGLFFQYQLARKHERYRAFLAHVETVCMQTLYRRLRRQAA